MNKKELVRKAIASRDNPFTPYHLDFTVPAAEALMKHCKTGDVDAAAGNDLVWLAPRDPTGFSMRFPAGKETRDEFGAVWKTTGVNRGYIIDHPLKEAHLAGYEFPDPHDERRYEDMQEAVDSHRGLFLVAWCGDFFERANFMRGLDNLLADLIQNRGFVHALLDELLEHNLGRIDELAKFDVDALFLSDDYGTQRSLMMSPAHWREFIRPRLEVMFRRIKKHGLFAFLHSCGNVTEIIPDLIEAGLDVLHPVQPEAMDAAKVKELYGKDLCLYGGISTQGTLRSSTPEGVKREVRKAVSVLGHGGGYILAPGITLQHDIPLDNIVAFIEAANEGRG